MVVKLFISGLPGSGKSSVARYIRTYLRDRGWECDHLNDYRILRRMYKDDIAEKQFKPGAHDGFDVHDLSVFDTALKTLACEVRNYTTREQQMLSIEFSRNDYRSAFSKFDQRFLQKEASKEITPFIDHIAPSYQLARRYSSCSHERTRSRMCQETSPREANS